MASMQFSYDGLRKPEPRKMCFFPPRNRQDHYFPQQVNNEAQMIEESAMEEQDPEVKQQRPEKQADLLQQTDSLPQAESLRQPEAVWQAESWQEPEAVPQERFFQRGASSSHEEARFEQQEGGASQQEAGASQQELGFMPQEAQPQTPPQQEASSFKQEQTQQQQSVAEISAILLENLANTEGQIVRIKEQVDYAKIIIDGFLFKLDSIAQIMDIVKANEVKSASLAEAQAVSYKSSRDSVDELLELFQGPVLQKLLRQFLIQIFVSNSGGTNLGRHT